MDRTGVDDGVSGGPGPVAPADTGAWIVDRGDGGAPTPDGWRTDVAVGGGAAGAGTGVATLSAVRSARHDAYDRVVFQFDAPVPRYRVEYVASPQHACGSGEPVRVAGGAWLQVSLEPANAHTEAGAATVPRQVADPPGALRELRLICDFEAHVELVIGVAQGAPYRAIVLSDPARLVVDIRR